MTQYFNDTLNLITEVWTFVSEFCEFVADLVWTIRVCMKKSSYNKYLRKHFFSFPIFLISSWVIITFYVNTQVFRFSDVCRCNTTRNVEYHKVLIVYLRCLLILQFLTWRFYTFIIYIRPDFHHVPETTKTRSRCWVLA